MKKLLVAVLVACALALTAPALALTAPALAQTTPAPATAQVSHRPWWRLAIFVPASLLGGAGVVVARRAARDRGWFGP
jgi:hypothetical protein